MNEIKQSLSRRAVRPAVFFLVAAGMGVVGFFIAPRVSVPQERSYTVHLRKYEYDPPVLRVNRGDTVRLKFVSDDVVHGFYLEGHDLDATAAPLRSAVQVLRRSTGKRETLEEVSFVATREGKFRFRCSQTCGYLHPFMLGEMIVRPNRLLPVSIGLAVGILLGGFIVVSLKEQTP
jgi:heme/copper-type cytochrome/quinol oxidase subunit 2